MGRLCELLDVASSPDESVGARSVKLLCFQLEQRVEELEKRIGELRSRECIEAAKESVLESAGNEGVLPGSERTAGERFEVRNALVKHDVQLSDVNDRVSELENAVGKIDPNRLRVIIQDIAELAMKKQAIEINSTVDNMKEKHTRDEQLIESLRQNIKEMNERFKSDIGSKVEFKDLRQAKNQLRRRVPFMCIRSCRNSKLNSKESPMHKRTVNCVL